MEDTNLSQEESQIAINNLQQANKLIRSRAIVLTFFLVLMMGFSLSINQNINEQKNLDKCYTQLMAIIRPDSMQKILKRDSLKYFYATSLGEYMSLEVLYDKLKLDSFTNTKPIHNAIDQVDELLRNKKKEQSQTAISIAGFSIPIRPVMLLAPILLLLLYHDFSVTMLYRNNLEEKIRKMKIPAWRTGPEFIGLEMFDFIPYKFRYMKGLWSLIQIVVLFLPTIPAFYFAMYGAADGEGAGWLVIITNLLCCIIILIDFFMLVDNENLLRIREVSMLFTGQKGTDQTSIFLKNRLALLIILPMFIGLLTFLAVDSYIERGDSIKCALIAFGQTTFLSIFSWLRSKLEKILWLSALFRMFAGGCFFASFYWFIIDLLICLGAIRFRDLTYDDFILFSFLLILFGMAFKGFYILYADKAEKKVQEPGPRQETVL